MSWDIPVLKSTEEVPPLALAKWFLGFVFLLVIIFFVCLVLYYIGVSKLIFQYGLISGIVLFILFGVAVGWHVLRISSFSERNELILLSNQRVESVCRAWMSEYITVADFSYVFPDSIEIDRFRRGEQFQVIGEKAIKFPENVNYTALFQELLCPFRYKLIDLLSRGKLEINFAAQGELINPLWSSFLFACKNINISVPETENTVFIVNQFSEKVEEWLESRSEKYRLVVFCNPLLVDDPQATITDGACAWLLAPTVGPDSSPGKFRMYRALHTEEKILKSDLNNLIKYQDGMNHPEVVLFSNVKSRSVVNEITYQCNLALRSKTNDGEIQQSFSHLVIGQQGVGNIWMAVTLAYLKSAGSSVVNVVASQEDVSLTLVQIRSLPYNKEQL
ncbi:hypothetical protein SIL08_00930 [Scandinavium sp. V105_16]|uniref:Uncharacterized protein n=1 Tax=Scandinavium lactucae TaxID=3095028 RepID=A0AAJ2VSY0_9ENTR|nr:MULTISPECIES: hypothetical protein [unclassified Scandinavium]MDX6018860.1 hypothetical protein [Scandinavium sp. V105_16]MDX6030178.1 hypothetical protein [Scandinavium sp. V105_12]